MAETSFDLLDFANNFPAKDGSYRLKSEDYFIEVLFQSNGVYDDSDYIIVSLGGAISNRKVKKAPFYTCMGLSKDIDLPLLSISDPSLNLSDDFSLGWYAGNEYQRQLPYRLADFFDCLIVSSKKKILFIGGSGGGFAILSIHALMKDVDNSVAIVWNPQTKIIDYSLGHANRYLNAAYANSKAWRDNDRESISEFLQENVRSEIFRDENKKAIVFMDGYDHNHLRLHLAPWLKGEELIRREENCLVYNNLIVYIGDWGSGHTPPPKSYLTFSAKKIVENRFFKMLFFFNSECDKPLLDISEKSCFEILERMRIRVNFFGAGLNVSFDINNYFVGYQIAINILDKGTGKVLARSGWLKNYHACQCFFTCENLISSLENISYQVCIYDFFGERYIATKLDGGLIYKYPLLKGKAV